MVIHYLLVIHSIISQRTPALVCYSIEGKRFFDSAVFVIVKHIGIYRIGSFIDRCKKYISTFLNTAERLWAKDPDELATVDPESFYILIPSFCVSELTKAFQIGFLVYLPFIAIDIIVSNILLAMGMMMVSPVTISLPFKLLLFVMVNGWTLLIQGLVKGYIL